MSEPESLLAGHLEEHEYARQRGVSVQTQRRDRKLGRSAPYVKFGKKYYYPIAEAKAHLAALVVYPPASPLRPEPRATINHVEARAAARARRQQRRDASA